MVYDELGQDFVVLILLGRVVVYVFVVGGLIIVLTLRVVGIFGIFRLRGVRGIRESPFCSQTKLTVEGVEEVRQGLEDALKRLFPMSKTLIVGEILPRRRKERRPSREGKG